MAFPSQSTALSGDPGSLWWGANYDGQDHNCATQGDTLVEQLQTTLRALAPSGGPPVASALPQLNPATLAIDKKLGAKTLTAMWNMLQQMGDAPQEILDAVKSDWQAGSASPNSSTTQAFIDFNTGQSISWGTMAAAIWISQHRDLAFSSLTIPTDIVTLLWGTEPPSDGTSHGVAVCWKAGDPVPLAAGGTDATTAALTPEGNYAMGGPGASNQTSSSFFNSVSQVFSGQTTGSSALDVLIPAGADVVAVGALALIAAGGKKRRRPARRRSQKTRRRR